MLAVQVKLRDGSSSATPIGLKLSWHIWARSFRRPNLLLFHHQQSLHCHLKQELEVPQADPITRLKNQEISIPLELTIACIHSYSTATRTTVTWSLRTRLQVPLLGASRTFASCVRSGVCGCSSLCAFVARTKRSIIVPIFLSFEISTKVGLQAHRHILS